MGGALHIDIVKGMPPREWLHRACALHAQIIAQHELVVFKLRRAAGKADLAFVQDVVAVADRKGGA